MFKIESKVNIKPNFTFKYVSENHADEVTWDDFLPQKHHLKSKNLSVYETETSTENLKIFVFKNDELFGLLYLQKLILVGKNIDFALTKYASLDCALKKLFSFNCDLSVLVCGNLYRNDFKGFYFINENDNYLLFSCLKDFFKVQNEAVGIIIKEFDSRTELNPTILNEFKFLGDDCTMNLNINSEWMNLNDYQANLSKKYRKRFEKIRNSAKNLEYKMLSLEEILQNQDIIYNLYLEVFEKQNVKLGKLSPNYFYEMKLILNENFEVFGVFENESLIGFSSHIHDNDTTEIHYIGFRNKLNEKYNLYFNLMYWGLENAIYNRKSNINFGRTAIIAKASIGAKPVEVRNFFYLKKGFVNLSLGFVFNSFYNNSEKELVLRNPFSE